MPTVPVPTGPRVKKWCHHVVASGFPGHNHFNVVVPTSWTGHQGGLGHFLQETTHVSRPLVPTTLIHTGPQFHARDRHFVAGERPVRNRFRMGQTFWAGHWSSLEIGWRRLSLEEKKTTGEIPSFEER